MEQDTNPYLPDGGNPYSSEEMTGGSSAGGGSGVPKSTKPRQEPSGSKPADPQDMLMQQMQMQMATQPPAAPGMAPGPAAQPGADAPAAPAGGAPASTPGAMARKQDEMVRYVLAHNPGLSPLVARHIVRQAEDYSGPTKMAPQVIPTMNIGNGIQHLVNEYHKADEVYQKKGPSVNPMMDRVKDFLNPKRPDRSPGDAMNGIQQRFVQQTRNLDPSHPHFQRARTDALKGIREQQQRLDEARNRHVSDAFITHRTLHQTGLIPKGHPYNDFNTYYHEEYQKTHPHPWQDQF